MCETDQILRNLAAAGQAKAKLTGGTKDDAGRAYDLAGS
jgi:hypothetical protein